MVPDSSRGNGKCTTGGEKIRRVFRRRQGEKGEELKGEEEGDVKEKGCVGDSGGVHIVGASSETQLCFRRCSREGEEEGENDCRIFFSQKKLVRELEEQPSAIHVIRMAGSCQQFLRFFWETLFKR